MLFHGVEEHHEACVKKRAKDHDFYAVLVSGVLRTARALDDRCYRRGAPVLAEDTRFGSYLERFCADLETNGELNFGLLEPSRYSPPLVAVYLVLLARKKQAELPLADCGWEGFWEPAWDAMVERETHIGSWKEAGLPTEPGELANWTETVCLEKAIGLLERHVVQG